MSTGLITAELSQAEFQRISQMVYRLTGIKLASGKEGLVKSRLMKRLRILQLDTFETYLNYVERDKSGRELKTMIDALTTNKTSFFREPHHFDYLRDHVFPKWKAERKRIRIWSAGCSSGEEPYSIAILLREEIPDLERRDVRILATDISTRMLETASQAEYDHEILREIPSQLLQKCFTLVRPDPPRTYRVKEEVKAIVRLARLNLMEAWPMRGPFDIIFCRNVMIYFDKPTQRTLVRRFGEMLEPSGCLFVGHSESLTASSRDLRYVQPAVYMKS
jgi:chemotaxis protein methyltransferase CheR